MDDSSFSMKHRANMHDLKQQDMQRMYSSVSIPRVIFSGLLDWSPLVDWLPFCVDRKGGVGGLVNKGVPIYWLLVPYTMSLPKIGPIVY